MARKGLDNTNPETDLAFVSWLLGGNLEMEVQARHEAESITTHLHEASFRWKQG